MEIKINTDRWLREKQILSLMEEEAKGVIKEYCAKNSVWLEEVLERTARSLAFEIKEYILDDDNLRKLIISEFIKSMSDDEKKKLFLEALLITRK